MAASDNISPVQMPPEMRMRSLQAVRMASAYMDINPEAIRVKSYDHPVLEMETPGRVMYPNEGHPTHTVTNHFDLSDDTPQHTSYHESRADGSTVAMNSPSARLRVAGRAERYDRSAGTWTSQKVAQ